MTSIQATTPNRNALITGLFGGSLQMEEKREVSKIPNWILEALKIEDELSVNKTDERKLVENAVSFFRSHPLKVNEGWDFVWDNLQSQGNTKSIVDILSSALQSDAVALPKIKGEFDRRGFLQTAGFLVTQALGGNPLVQALGRNRSHGAVPNPILVFTSERAKDCQRIGEDFFPGGNYLQWIEFVAGTREKYEASHPIDNPRDRSNDELLDDPTYSLASWLIQRECLKRSQSFSLLKEKMSGDSSFRQLSPREQEDLITESLTEGSDRDLTLRYFEDSRRGKKLQRRYSDLYDFSPDLLYSGTTIRDSDLDGFIKLTDSIIDLKSLPLQLSKEAERILDPKGKRRVEELKQEIKKRKKQNTLLNDLYHASIARVSEYGDGYEHLLAIEEDLRDRCGLRQEVEI